MFPVAILAGGLATRLRPITQTIPKAIVDVAGKPFIERQLDYLRTEGITHVVLCVGHLGEMIEEVVGTGAHLGLTVSYSYDGSQLLGTGGALKKALPLLSDHFFILYGDSYLPITYHKVQDSYERCGRPALMTVLKNGDRWDKSNVLFIDGELIAYNKHNPHPDMSYIDYGLGLVSADIFTPYPYDSSFDLADVYQELSARNALAGFEVHDRFYEIGSHQGLKETNQYFINKELV
jgi:NDP-sugar pyrophosphorylase family protein